MCFPVYFHPQRAAWDVTLLYCPCGSHQGLEASTHSDVGRAGEVTCTAAERKKNWIRVKTLINPSRNLIQQFMLLSQMCYVGAGGPYVWLQEVFKLTSQLLFKWWTQRILISSQETDHITARPANHEDWPLDISSGFPFLALMQELLPSPFRSGLKAPALTWLQQANTQMSSASFLPLRRPPSPSLGLLILI